MRRILAAIVLALSAWTAQAQAPTPVPPLPDTERRTAYAINASTCNCAVNFALYGDGTDYQNWIEVWINGVQIPYNSLTTGWSISSPTGPLGTIPLPITDAILNFTLPQTGTVEIVGARRPRRLGQFPVNQGVGARDLNQVFTDIVAQNRETWDKVNDVTGRALISQPGNTVGLLPLPTACQNKLLGFDATGLNPTCSLSTAALPLSIANGGTGSAGPWTANLPLLGNGTGPLIQGTVSGTTTTFGTTSGVLANGDCVSINNGNLVDAGGACSIGSGGGTVSAGTAGQLAYYASSGTVLTGATTGSGVLTALALAANATGGVATYPVSIASGVSGLGSGVSTALAAATGASGGIPPISGATVNGDCVKWGSGGSLVDAGGGCGSGTIASGITYAIPYYSGSGPALVPSAYLTINGGVLSLTALPAASTYFALNAASGHERGLLYNTSAAARWNVAADSETESGSNAGSNLLIARYNDAGTFIDTPLSILRSTGLVQIADNIQVNGGALTVTNAGGATVYMTSPTGTVRAIEFSSGSSERWFAGADAETESGGNAGSNFFINRYSDAGAYIDTPIEIIRSNGVMNLQDSVVWSNAAASSQPTLLEMSFNGASSTPPYQITPVSNPVAISAVLADSAGGNIFQTSSWVSNSGSRPTVAVFGEGVGTANGSNVWGGNFVSVAAASGAVARGSEVDFEAQAAGATAYGQIIVNVSAIANPGAFLQFNSNSGSAANGIVINFDGAHQPIAGNIMTLGGAVATVNGINFGAGSFSGYPFLSPGFSVDGVGNVTAQGYHAGANVGISCGPASPTSSFTVADGIVTHC